ncbi:CRAL/TRIO domain-containing protein [Exidia glandulosa HHB12029]|uniref:CRAL/TRIO domain-containing protein n=1 Tax=Exidia glandulosa HHB12029 TaxID=1314781 RepID=A0A165FF17_EXIGL|nr:CRAL/TRIO domain-containing protein [Exidia glandulosa HHB12029]
MTDVVKVPKGPPAPPEGATRPAHLELTGDDASKRDGVLAHFQADGYTLDGTPLSDEEKFWLTDECLQRYLRASKWVEATTKMRLEATLKWRREYGFGTDAMAPDAVEMENETGKQIIFGYDNQRHPALYLLPSRQNTDGPPRQIRATVFMLERVLDLCGPGVESLALLINFADRAKNPSLSTARSVLNILQEHYPERLGAAYIVKVPWMVNLFFKAILPFVDPKTRTKLFFNPDVVKDGLMPSESLLKADGWDGACNFEYDHSVYWPALVQLCAEKHAKEHKAWRDLGGKIGESEWAIKVRASEDVHEHTTASSEVVDDAPAATPPVLDMPNFETPAEAAVPAEGLLAQAEEHA